MKTTRGGGATFGMFLKGTSPRSARSSRTASSLLSLRSASLLSHGEAGPVTLSLWDMVMPRPSNRGFETLIREHVEEAASDED